MSKTKKIPLKDNFLKGIIKENPTFVLILGMCPTLGTTTSLENAFGMGVSVLFVLIITNAVISAIRKIVPADIRIPVYITVIALVVTLIEWFIQAYFPTLYTNLGVFLPLIVVNCIVLGRAEAYASDNTIFDSIIDGASMGLGFTLGLSTLGFVRELLGTGSVLGLTIMDAKNAATFLIQPTGAFLTLGLIVGVINTVKISKEKKAKAIMDEKIRIALEKKALKEAAKALEEKPLTVAEGV